MPFSDDIKNTQGPPIVDQNPDGPGSPISVENGPPEEDPETEKYQKLLTVEEMRENRFNTRDAWIEKKELNDLRERPDKITFTWKLKHVLKVFLNTRFWKTKDGATYGIGILGCVISALYLYFNGRLSESSLPFFFMILQTLSQIGSIWTAKSGFYNSFIPSVSETSYLSGFTAKNGDE